jgi:hypothetical protein
VLSSQIARSSRTSDHGVDLEEADLQLEIPEIDTPSGFGGMSVGGRTSAGAGSVAQAALGDLYEDTPFIDDAEFEIAADGSLVAVNRNRNDGDRGRTGSDLGDGRAISESGFSARVRNEHEVGAATARVSEKTPDTDDTDDIRDTIETSRMTT